MIGWLKGNVLEKHPPILLLNVNGVGYELQAPMTIFYQVEIGQELAVYTHLAVREDAHSLYAFANKTDRDFFRDLLKISGVGAKLALAILSSMSLTDFIICVQQQDVSSLIRLPGVGKKTAQRLVIELKDKVKNVDSSAVADPTVAVAGLTEVNDVQDAIDALMALGYPASQAQQMINPLKSQPLSSQEMIRLALKSTMS